MKKKTDFYRMPHFGINTHHNKNNFSIKDSFQESQLNNKGARSRGYPNDKNAPLPGNFDSFDNVGDYGLAAVHLHRSILLYKVSLHQKQTKKRFVHI